MKKKILGVGVATVLVILLFFLTGCGNKNNTVTNNESKNDVSESSLSNIGSQSQVDLSEYDDYGSFFGDDLNNQIAWVCKSDYNGRRYGYINSKGEFVIPLSTEIMTLTNTSDILNNYQDGKVVVSTTNQEIIIYDTKGEVVTKYENAGGAHESKNLSNGNILITGQGLYPDAYMYIASNNEIIKLPYTDPITCQGNYSDGLLACEVEGKGIIYLDEQGNEKLRIDTSDNSAYMAVLEGSSFENGKATITFQGRDYKKYEVNIDKNGEWLDEPILVDDDIGY